MAECRTTRARTCLDVEAAMIGHAPYCEDQRFTIGNGGQRFKALYVAPEVESISNDDRNEVLELLSSFYDLSGCKPKIRVR